MRSYYRQASVLVALAFLGLLVVPASAPGQGDVPVPVKPPPSKQPKLDVESSRAIDPRGRRIWETETVTARDPRTGDVIYRRVTVTEYQMDLNGQKGKALGRTMEKRDEIGNLKAGSRDSYKDGKINNTDRYDSKTGIWKPELRDGKMVSGVTPTTVLLTPVGSTEVPRTATVVESKTTARPGEVMVPGVKWLKGVKVEKAEKAALPGAPKALKADVKAPAKVVKPALPTDLKVPAKAAEAPKAPAPALPKPALPAKAVEAPKAPAPPPVAPAVAKPAAPAAPPTPPAPPAAPPAPKAVPLKVTPKLPPPPPPKEGPPPTIS